MNNCNTGLYTSLYKFNFFKHRAGFIICVTFDQQEIAEFFKERIK